MWQLRLPAAFAQDARCRTTRCSRQTMHNGVTLKQCRHVTGINITSQPFDVSPAHLARAVSTNPPRFCSKASDASCQPNRPVAELRAICQRALHWRSKNETRHAYRRRKSSKKTLHRRVQERAAKPPMRSLSAQSYEESAASNISARDRRRGQAFKTELMEGADFRRAAKEKNSRFPLPGFLPSP